MKYDFRLFTNLRSISIDGAWSSNRLDLSGNTNLEKIKIKCKNLEELILPENAPLKEFTCIDSQLKGIDLNNFKDLEIIDLQCNDVLTEVDISGLPSLTAINCSANKLLNTITISDCANLKHLNCASNNLASLNITGCENIEKLNR